MTWEKGTREIGCPECGAKRLANFMNLPAREQGSFDRLVCGKQSDRWNGGVDYSGWRLADK